MENRIDKILSSVAEDLWGVKFQESEPEQPAAPAYQPSFPPFEQLWKTADETVDWTEALVSAEPVDGLTNPQLWRFYHSQAKAVLDGDLHAYAEVLRAGKPLHDLTRYTTALAIDVNSADKLTARFTPAECYLQQDGRRYLCGMALRIARDLMALLPVTTVRVEASNHIDTTFTRAQLQKVRFTFVDPVAFVEGL